MNYKLVNGPDGIVWVSLQPLRDDVMTQLNKLTTIDTSEFSETDKDIMDFNVVGLRAIATFLNALEQEAKTNENIDRPTTH